MEVNMGGGGGGNTTTTTSGVPEFAKPYLKEVLGDVTQRYRDETSGGTPVVAGLAPEQEAALARQQGLSDAAFYGTGIYDDQAAVQRQLQNLQGANLAGQANTGTLGSARSDRAMQSALADQAYQFQQGKKADVERSTQALQHVGDTRQQQRQLELDAPHTSAQRYFGYLGSTGQESTANQGGGK